MTAYNVVRFKVKPGREEEFIEAYRSARIQLHGFRHGTMIDTGNHGYYFIGEWDKLEHILNAEEELAAIIDTFRDTLEDLGGGLGVSDEVTGETVFEIET